MASPEPAQKTKMFTKEKVKLPSGFIVEMTLDEPENLNDSGNKLAVLLHPWSWLGGRMNDPVLRNIREVLKHRGFHTLLYNSRGVGGSSGWPSFSGIQEGEDLKEIVQWSLSYISDVRHVLLVGYSYGSLIAAQHPNLPPPIKTAHILLSYPLDKRMLLTFFHSGTHCNSLDSRIRDSNSNILIMYGDHDEFTTAKSYETWANVLQEEAPWLQTTCIRGGTHFWRDEDCVAMLKKVAEWIES